MFSKKLKTDLFQPAHVVEGVFELTAWISRYTILDISTIVFRSNFFVSHYIIHVLNPLIKCGIGAI